MSGSPPGRSTGPPPAADLCAFVDASPSPFHTVAELARRLEAAGFRALDEREAWELSPGDAWYVVRGGSVAALRVGTAPVDAAGFRVAGAHTDSPTFKVRPRPGLTRAGYGMVGVEVYGGPLLHTWLDRDLTVAGRVVTRDGAQRLVVLPGAPVRLASLAIHLDRALHTEGLRLNPQDHLQPLWAPSGDVSLVDAVAAEARVDAGEILGHDLVLADTLPAAVVGHDGAFVAAPRLDNLSSCHAGVTAIIGTEAGPATQVLVCNDHEEVGSGSAEGAKGSFLEDVLARVVAATAGGDPQAGAVARARSLLVSADAAHAVHPNWADRHDPEHRPRFGGGPVVKSNANQSYASDARTVAWFTARCADAGIPVQHFVSRADLPCGSTIGPLSATRLGIATVDIGNPVLGMHSARETAGAGDVAPLTAALAAHLTAEVGDQW